MSRKNGNGQERYLETNSTQASTELVAGRTQTDPENTAAAHARRRIGLGSAFRGVRGTGVGVGANNVTSIWAVWSIRRGLGTGRQHQPGAATPIGDWDLTYEGKLTFTAMNALGATDTSLVRTTERLADTVVWEPSSTSTAPKGPRSSMEASNGLGTSFAYSPADDTPGMFSIPDLDGADSVLFERIGGTSTSSNLILEATP